MQQHYRHTTGTVNQNRLALGTWQEQELATPSDRWHVGTRKTEQLLKLAERYEMLVIPA